MCIGGGWKQTAVALLALRHHHSPTVHHLQRPGGILLRVLYRHPRSALIVPPTVKRMTLTISLHSLFFSFEINAKKNFNWIVIHWRSVIYDVIIGCKHINSFFFAKGLYQLQGDSGRK